MRHVLSVLVDNQFGVLSRIAGLFSRRGYNIDSITAGETNDPTLTRLTIVANGDDYILEQIQKQLSKLVDVRHVLVLDSPSSVYRELALVKISANSQTRTELAGIVDIFRASIIDITAASITVEITGDDNKIGAFLELCQPFGIKEVARTGITALERGYTAIQEYASLQ